MAPFYFLTGRMKHVRNLAVAVYPITWMDRTGPHLTTFMLPFID